MALRRRDVKPDCGFWNYSVQRCIAWVDRHPRLGWYLAALGVLNLVLNLLQVILTLAGS